MENNQLIALVTVVVGSYAQPWFGEEFFADQMARASPLGMLDCFFVTVRYYLKEHVSKTRL
jgi:hypothetical protein